MENCNKSRCELCRSPATTYCESDRARLCWHCDGKVHKANFLVSKHSRTLLCHLCHGPTPWAASGPMLPPSLSFCVSCALTTSSARAAAAMTPVQPAHLPIAHDEHDGEYDSYEDEDEDDNEEEYNSGNDDVEEEDEDNQVVPLTTTTPLSSVVPSDMNNSNNNNNVSSSSSNDGEDDDNYNDDDCRVSSMGLPSSLKRKRQFYMLS